MRSTLISVAFLSTIATADSKNYSERKRQSPPSMSWGKNCATLQDQECAETPDCTSCRWSWPSNDPAQWNSADAQCRCEADSGESPQDGPPSMSWGNDCATLQDQECAETPDCTSCKWSWPSNDTAQWNSPDAQCRCASDSGQGSPTSGGMAWGNDCATLTDQECAETPDCTSCKWSWPSDDPAGWKSVDAQCRCAADSGQGPQGSPPSMSWGNDCATLQDQECAETPDCTSCKWSWPSDDPAQWNSADAQCRCAADSGQGPQGSPPSMSWGNDCATLQDQECAETPDCTSCKWSWPSNDPAGWKSMDAQCRCAADSGQGSPTSGGMAWGNDCATLTDQECAETPDCTSCKWSWPSDDPAKWNSVDAQCRCASDSGQGPQGSPPSMSWGNDCATLQDQECAETPDCTSCKWSWPSNDPAGWKSVDAQCRCAADSGQGPQGSPPSMSWGNDCATLTDQECAESPGCTSCKWSWPSNDPAKWNSADAQCRCAADSGQGSPTSEGMAWGNDCATLQDQECAETPNCASCRWSWPRDDPAQWESKDAQCRCAEDSAAQDQKVVNYVQGNACANLNDQDCANVLGCTACTWTWRDDDPGQWSGSSAMCRCTAPTTILLISQNQDTQSDESNNNTSVIVASSVLGVSILAFIAYDRQRSKQTSDDYYRV